MHKCVYKESDDHFGELMNVTADWWDTSGVQTKTLCKKHYVYMAGWSDKD